MMVAWELPTRTRNCCACRDRHLDRDGDLNDRGGDLGEAASSLAAALGTVDAVVVNVGVWHVRTISVVQLVVSEARPRDMPVCAAITRQVASGCVCVQVYQLHAEVHHSLSRWRTTQQKLPRIKLLCIMCSRVSVNARSLPAAPSNFGVVVY